jgi:hypothetical protein
MNPFLAIQDNREAKALARAFACTRNTREATVCIRYAAKLGLLGSAPLDHFAAYRKSGKWIRGSWEQLHRAAKSFLLVLG